MSDRGKEYEDSNNIKYNSDDEKNKSKENVK